MEGAPKTNPGSKMGAKKENLEQLQQVPMLENVTLSTPATNRSVQRAQMHMTQPSWRVGYGSLRV